MAGRPPGKSPPFHDALEALALFRCGDVDPHSRLEVLDPDSRSHLREDLAFIITDLSNKSGGLDTRRTEMAYPRLIRLPANAFFYET